MDKHWSEKVHLLDTNTQSCARDIFLALRQRQHKNVIEPQGPEKFRKIFKSRCHNKYSNIAITNNFVAWKHGHVVAAVFSRAQLCKYLLFTNTYCSQTLYSNPISWYFSLCLSHSLSISSCCWLDCALKNQQHGVSIVPGHVQQQA